MTDESTPIELQAPNVPPQARPYLLDNLRKARETRSANAAARRIEKQALKAEQKAEKQFEKDEMAGRKPGEPGQAEGPSLERVEELVQLYPNVSVDVRQTTATGRITNLNDNYVVETKELYAFRKHLEMLGGGGQYKCRVRNPDNLGEILMTFRMVLPGQSKVHAAAPQAPDPWAVGPIPPPFSNPLGMPQQFVAQPSPQATSLPTTPTSVPQEQPVQYPPGQLPPVPPQYRSLSPEQQWAFYMAQQQMQQRPGGVYSSDQIAMHQNQQLLIEKARLESNAATLQEKYAASQRDMDTKLAAIRAELERAREEERKRADRLEMELREAKLRAESDKRDADHRAEMAALRAAIDKMTNAPAPAPVVKETNGGGIEKFAIFIPVILEFMRSSSSKDEAERNRSAENMKMMLASMKRDPGIEGEAMKYMVEVLKSKVDEKEATANAQVLMLGAISGMMKDMMPEAEPRWVQIAEAAIDSLKGMVGGAMMQNVKLPGGEAPAQNLPAGNGDGKTEVLNHGEQLTLKQWHAFQKQNEPVAKIVYTAYMHPSWPRELDTLEWRLLIFNLHMQTNIDVLVMLYADHLELQRELGFLPAVFNGVFENPQAVLEPIIKALPISSMNAAYANEFLTEIVAEISDRETERLRVEKEDAEEAQETQAEVVT